MGRRGPILGSSLQSTLILVCSTLITRRVALRCYHETLIRRSTPRQWKDRPRSQGGNAKFKCEASCVASSEVAALTRLTRNKGKKGRELESSRISIQSSGVDDHRTIGRWRDARAFPSDDVGQA